MCAPPVSGKNSGLCENSKYSETLSHLSRPLYVFLNNSLTVFAIIGYVWLSQLDSVSGITCVGGWWRCWSLTTLFWMLASSSHSSLCCQMPLRFSACSISYILIPSMETSKGSLAWQHRESPTAWHCWMSKVSSLTLPSTILMYSLISSSCVCVVVVAAVAVFRQGFSV